MDLIESWMNEVGTKVTFSVILILLMTTLREVIRRGILARVKRSDERRRWLVNIRNVLVFLTVVGLAAIWADALRTLALSLLAFAVAFVIATKELLQSVLGSALRTATNSYSIGDRIELGNHRGDVIDQTLLTTTILEVGPGRTFHLRTGRVITFPNNKLLDSYVINESYNRQYVTHVFSIPMKAEQDWQKAEKILLEAANEQCAGYIQSARENMKHMEEAHGLEGLPLQPRVSVQVSDPGKLNLLVRVPVPVGRQGRIEQAIVRRFLSEFYPAKLEEPTAGPVEEIVSTPAEPPPEPLF